MTPHECRQRQVAQDALQQRPVVLSGREALSIGRGFSAAVNRNRYQIWARSILPQHVHLVIGRHHYSVERIVNQLKGAATRQVRGDGFRLAASGSQAAPRIWAERLWKVFLDCEQQIETAIRYVEENPELEGKRRQHWSFVNPFEGLPDGHCTYH